MTDAGVRDGDVRDGGFDEFLDALVEDRGYYLECAEGCGSLPPRRVCPHCGSRAIEERPLPDTGEIATFTVVTVPTPAFEDDAPYVTAVADFGPVRITGQVRRCNPSDVETGLAVTPDVGRTETTGERLIVLYPA